MNNRTSSNGTRIRHFIETTSLAITFLIFSVILLSVMNTKDIISFSSIVYVVLAGCSFIMFLAFSIGLLWNRISKSYEKIFEASQTSRISRWGFPIFIGILWSAIVIGFLVGLLQYPTQIPEPFRSAAIWLAFIWPIYVSIAIVIIFGRENWNKIGRRILRMQGRNSLLVRKELQATQIVCADDIVYLADTPISSLKEDRLGRSRFARYLGDAILAWRSDDSVVIGLYGRWGLGKTSILNMVVDHIKEETKNMPTDMRPLILRFNPWNFSEQNQLISMFFHELSILLGRKDKSKAAKRLGKKLETYGKFFEPLAFIPSVGLWATLIAKLLKAVGRSSSQWGKLKEQDLAGLREEINHLLKERKNRTIIVIDDIDRLNPVETKQTFQLLKLNADFPNTIYVTAFDPEVVAGALGTSYQMSGKEYLEKIVQISFDVPPIEPSRLALIFFEELNKTVSCIPEENWDQRRWGNLYHSGFKMLLNTLRDVKRFVNGLRFDLSLVLGEIDPVDLIGIEGIRIFAPATYQLMAQNKTLFTAIEHTDARDILRQQYEKVFSETPEHIRETVRQICRQLFPQLAYAYENVSYGADWQAKWRRELRICATEIFDRYFLLEVPESEISEIKLREILGLAGDVAKFISALQELNKDGKIRKFLERLEDYTSIVPVGHVEPICQALFDIGDELPLEQLGFADLGSDLQAVRVIYQLLQRIESEQDRAQILGAAVSRSQSVYFPVHIVSLEEPNKSDSKKSLVSESSFHTLKDGCIERIQEASRSSRLQKTPKLDYVLFRWQEWGDVSDVKQYVDKLLDTPEGLADFLAGFMSQRLSQSSGDYVAKIEWVLPVKNIQKFTNLDLVKERVASLKEEETGGFSPRQLLAIETFRAGTSTKGSNKLSEID